MSHFAYVTAAYAISALALGALLAWIVIDQRVQRRALKDLEARGVRRRSARQAGSHDG